MLMWAHNVKRVSLLLGLALCAPACSSRSSEKTPDAGKGSDAGEPSEVGASSVVESPAVLGLTLNDATSSALVVGWPAALRLQVAWMTEATTPLLLDAGSLALVVSDAAGTPVTWPWLLATVLPDSTSLGPDTDVLELAWTLSAAQASALVPGRYTLRASWGGLRTPPLEVDVLASPVNPSSAQRGALARLAADVALLRGEAGTVLTVLDDGLAAVPGAPALLGDKAAALEAIGELAPALEANRAALQGLDVQNPGGVGEPPVTLLQRHRRLLDHLIFKGGSL